MSIAEREKVKAEQDLAEAKKGPKEHDHHYLQLNQVLQTCRKHLLDLEVKVTELNAKLGCSQSEVAHIRPQVMAAYSV